MATTPTFSQIDPQLLELIQANDALLLDPALAVYTNRDLELANIELVGFDMDYTLAVYHKQPMEQLQYQLTMDRLIEKWGYPVEIRRLAYDPSLIIRGLVVDKRRGHLLKMDAHGQVWRAMHGRRQLMPDEIERLYRNTKIKIGSQNYPSLDTLFAMPEACLYCNLMDFFESKRALGESIDPLTQPHSESGDVSINTGKLFDDIRASIDEIHSDDTLKSTITGDIKTYINSDADIALTLHKLRSVGKRLFLLTNSHWEYTDFVMSYLLNDRLPEYGSWRAYFDIVIVAASKPLFFVGETPFKETSEVTFDRNKIYIGGNIKDFERLTGCRGDQILYVGDHIYGDIVRSKKESLWRTCLILEELPIEIQSSLHFAKDIDGLAELEAERFFVDNHIGRHRSLLAHLEAGIRKFQKDQPDHPEISHLFRAARIVRRELDTAKKFLKELDEKLARSEDELERRFNPYWGRLLREQTTLSRFGAQVQWYACIYTGRVANLLQYSPVHVFRHAQELMSHDRTLLNTTQMRKARGQASKDKRSRHDHP